MKTSKLLSYAGCACVLALIIAAPGQAQQAQQTPPAQPGMPRTPIKATLGTMPSEFLLLKVTVSDMPKSYDFYTKILGLQRVNAGQARGEPPALGSDPNTWPMSLLLNYTGTLADPYVSLNKPRGPMPTRDEAKSTTIGFKVPDAHAVTERAKAAGYEVESNAPTVGPGELSIGMLRDPDGYSVEVLQSGTFPKN